jgi:hypothetical protein
LNTKYKIKQQSKNGFPLAISVNGGLTFTSMESNHTLDSTENFDKTIAHRFNYFGQILFARKINNIFNELQKTNKHLTEEGNQKIQYFKEFMERESKFLKDISKILGLDPANELSKKILSIKIVLLNYSSSQ